MARAPRSSTNGRREPTSGALSFAADPDLAVGDVLGSADVPPPPVEPQKIVDEARQLFNEHRFWEVHEVLEGLWKTLKGPEKELVQGLILASAAFVHAQKDEEPVTWPMLQDALKRLADQPDLYYGWNIESFRNHFARILMEQKLTIPTM